MASSSVASSPTTGDVVRDGETWIVFDAPAPSGIGVFLIRPDGTGRHQLDFEAPGSFKHPDWSPDGRTITAVREDDNTIWMIGADGSNPRKLQIASCVDTCDYPAFSPDGNRIAFSVIGSNPAIAGPASGSIHVAYVDGSNERELVKTERPEIVDSPRWSPDGHHLVVQIDEFNPTVEWETGCSVAIIDVATGKLQRLTEKDRFGSGPDWHRPGIMFGEAVRVFRKDADPLAGSFDLWVVDPAGGEPRALTRVGEGVHLLQSSWTPDGTSIIATLEAPGKRTGVFVDPASGTWTEIAGGPMGHPRVRPGP